VIATGLALGMAVVPLATTRASSPSPQAEPLPVEANPIAEVRELHELGMVWFEAGDHDEALVMWKLAFGLAAHDLDQQATRAVLVANIVTADTRAYEVDRNPKYLVDAMRVIDVRRTELAQLHNQGEITVDETVRLEGQRAELSRLHALALSEAELPSEDAAGTASDIQPAPPLTPPPTPTRKQLDAAVAADPEFGSSYRQGKRMSDWGTVVLLVVGPGLGITILCVAGFPPKDAPWSTVLPTLVPIGGAWVGGMVVGGTVLAVGNKRREQARQGYQAKPSPTGMVVPMSLPRGGGLGFVGRF
jgi:hypothetical protein